MYILVHNNTTSLGERESKQAADETIIYFKLSAFGLSDTLSQRSHYPSTRSFQTSNSMLVEGG